MSPVTWLLVALGAAFSPAPPSASAVVERVVAVIRPPASAEARVVTLTRVEEEVRIALVSSGAALAATQPLDAAALRAGLEWLVDQMLLSEEAARLQVFEIEQAEVLEELARFQARFERPVDWRAFLARYDLSDEELAAVLERTLRVRLYVESRLSQTGRVSESDVTRDRRHRLELPADRGAARAARARSWTRFREEVTAGATCARSDMRRVYDFEAAEEGAGPARRDPEG
jgi:hypothetical protein